MVTSYMGTRDFPSAGPELSHAAWAVCLRPFSLESTALPFSNAKEREAIIAGVHLDTLHHSYTAQSQNGIYSISGTDVDVAPT